MLKGILVMSCIRPCVQLFMGLALCIADKSLGRNGQQIGMLMYPDDNYGYYCLCVCLTVCWCFHLLGLVFIFFSKVRVGAKEGGSHYWEMAVAITCGYEGYLLPLLAAHSSCYRGFPPHLKKQMISSYEEICLVQHEQCYICKT